jgi:hypothetical protein
MKFSQALKAACLLCAVMLPAAARAQFYYPPWGFYTNNGAITIQGYGGSDGVVTVPSTFLVNGVNLSVTGIDPNVLPFPTALLASEEMRSLTVPA